MENLKYKLVFMVLFLSTIIAFGQTDTVRKSDNGKKTSYFSTSLNYISDAVFMGRKDSVSAPYLYPTVSYHHKSGFYGNGSFSYLTKSNESRVDLFLVTAGYDFTKNNLSGDFSVTKYFFNQDSYNVISEVEADLTSNLRYDFGNVFNLLINASLYFNSNSSSDFFLSPEISHDFLTTNQKFQFTPTVGINFGTQNFYEEYYTNTRLGNGGGQGQGSGSTAQTTIVINIQESEKFNMMAIEFSLPMWYSHKQLTFSFLPVLVLPQNPATITVDDVVIEEGLEDTFYWMVGISYLFGKN
ncbi:MAG: hypothetical protein WBA61_09875 [Aequorivita sp.]